MLARRREKTPVFNVGCHVEILILQLIICVYPVMIKQDCEVKGCWPAVGAQVF